MLEISGVGIAAGATILTAVLGTMRSLANAGGAEVGDKTPEIRLVNLAGEPFIGSPWA